MILVDTNILIDYLRGVDSAREFVGEKGKSTLAINAIIAMELYQGCLNRKEFAKIRKELNGFFYLELNEVVTQVALQLSQQFALSHHITVGDAFIAATALVYNLELRTYNLRDFQFIPTLLVSNQLS